MTRKLIAFIILLLLFAITVIAYSYINLKTDAAVILDMDDSTLLALECYDHSASNGDPKSNSSCKVVNGEIHLNFKDRARLEGQIASKSYRYAWDDLVQIKNRTSSPAQIDVNVSEEWPAWAGICITFPTDAEEAWFVQPESGDTGYTYHLAPYSTLRLGFRLKLPRGIASLGFPTHHIPAITIKATSIP